MKPLKRPIYLASLISLSLIPGLNLQKLNAEHAFGRPQILGESINTPMHESHVVLSRDGLSMYFDRTDEDGIFANPEVWIASRDSYTDAWSNFVSLGPWIDSETTFAPTIFESMLDIMSDSPQGWCTADGLEVYFWEDMLGGFGALDLFMMKRETINSAWSSPINLGGTINTSRWDYSPWISPDGLTLHYASTNRPGGQGRSDIWVTKRVTRADPWGLPTNLGSAVNSSSWDHRACLTQDGLCLLFESGRAGGFGGGDIWMTKRASLSAPWGQAINIGPLVNTPRDETRPHISPDGSTLYFNSDRLDGIGGHDLWEAPIVPIVDFSGDGQVDEKDVIILVDNWGQTDSLCDIGPYVWGDGIVDEQDLFVMAEYLGEDFVDPTLIAHWPFDEVGGYLAWDSAGDHDGTLMTMEPRWHLDGGKVGGALELDGIDDVVIVDPGPEVGDRAFSIITWIKGGVPGQTLLSRKGTRLLYASATDGTLTTDLSATQDKIPLGSDAVVTDDDWHRIALIWDGTNRILYADGQEVAREALDHVDLADSPLVIGTESSFTPGTYFSGLIDDLRIYNRVSSP